MIYMYPRALINAHFSRRRSKRWDDIIEKEEDQDHHRPRMSLGGEDVQPRPYHVGLLACSFPQSLILL